MLLALSPAFLVRRHFWSFELVACFPYKFPWKMQEWPEEIYPPYANGPGYIISNDIASFIVSKHANQTLRVSTMQN